MKGGGSGGGEDGECGWDDDERERSEKERCRGASRCFTAPLLVSTLRNTAEAHRDPRCPDGKLLGVVGLRDHLTAHLNNRRQSSVVFPATMDLEFYGDQHKPAARMSATKKVKFSLELPGVVKQEPVDASYDAPADPHCVPSAAGRPQQAMQKVPDITGVV
ncbi:hypothetical protein O3P69_020533 [Scylla paramamosain]|uniref:Uncharacterized protein n=1 Tax=Scylla paramamosain TaxID=85552 RepID=A0AAW0TM60_SCYPA